MRLEIDGLWNGWTHDDFTGSWSGADRAFVFQLNSRGCIRFHVMQRGLLVAIKLIIRI